MFMNQQMETVEQMENTKKLECALGTIPYQDHEVIHFDEGLFGYEDEHEFVLLEDAQYYPFRWLISVDNPELMFPVVNPKEVLPEYHPSIQELNHWDFLVNIVTLGEAIHDVTVNLRAPILMKKVPRRAKQTILTDSNYSLRYNLFK